ncbi:MAG: hypothetical protein MJ240_00155 [Kiritimatiellae bacterium]|nr:hypothetical protein [Kiritimatiellia bacterium]
MAHIERWIVGLALVACGMAQAMTCATKGDYLDLMEAAVSAYDDAHIAAYVEAADRDGVQEHGFPRLVANVGVLVANGRLSERRDLFRRMMTIACRDAAKGKMPPKSGGNEFSVKELVVALVALEKSGTFPKAETDAWRKALTSVDAKRCYSKLPKCGAKLANNWCIFGCASEQARLAARCGGDAQHIEMYVADQLRWFDENGMYKDPNQPAVYDFVTRLQFAMVLHYGYDGPSRERLEGLMAKSAEPTLAMLSACGEIPYGGRSNQFLHNNTFYSALCEWYAAGFAKRGDLRQAARFRRAAKKSVDAVREWLAVRPMRHVKNLYPRKSGKEVYSREADMGCERYAYFNKYMVTMGSWAMSAWLFAEDVAKELPEEAEVAASSFRTSDDFHFFFLKAGDYSAQFDPNANRTYDADGLGRICRKGAPAAICLSVPCAVNPHYRIETPNDAPLTIAPVAKGDLQLSCTRFGNDDKSAWADWKSAAGEWRNTLTGQGLEMTLEGAGPVALALPAFAFDGECETRIDCKDTTLAIAYRGWRCVYTVKAGTIVDTGRVACNRNGRYRRFELRGDGRVAASVTIERIR